MQLDKFLSQREKINEVVFAENLKLVAEVIFGVSSQGCRGAGICKLTTLPNSEMQNKMMAPCKKAIVVISKSLKRDKLCFQFDKNSMCPHAIKANFEFGFFLVQENVELPLFIQSGLDTRRASIEKGAYPVIETKDSLTVVF